MVRHRRRNWGGVRDLWSCGTLPNPWTPDLYLPPDSFFPVIANWRPKSEAVAEILRVWNVGPESVVYVDDSLMELEEVRSAFPAMVSLQFPSGAPDKIIQLLEQLRDLFGKPALTGDDALRQNSIRANAQFQEAAGTAPAAEFIKHLRAKVTFDPRKDDSNGRLLELINKTNQFNLNGMRIAEREWLRFLASPASFAVSVSYEDKFGPLGVVSVVAGQRSGDRLDVQTWVLSCRAFSRAIELHVLDYLFRSTGAKAIALGFRATERNRPLQDFLHSLGLNTSGEAECVVWREELLQARYQMPHEVIVSGEPKFAVS
jgi:FkbH-like protein